jgi:hypothetical protein
MQNTKKVEVAFPTTVLFSLREAESKVFPVVVFGGGDTQWISCDALGKENFEGVACNHCKQKHLGDGIGELWSLESWKEAAATCDGIQSEATDCAGGPQLLESPALVLQPDSSLALPALHDMLGSVLDAV